MWSLLHKRPAALGSASVAALTGLAAILMGGCAAGPDARTLAATAVHFRTVEGSQPMRDGRAMFRETFCSSLRADGVVPDDDFSCVRWLWRLPDEPAAAAPDREPAGPVATPPEYKNAAVFVVTGAFSECVGEAGRPFIAGVARLRETGARVETIVVSGRSGTGNNARQIAAAIEKAQLADDQRILMIGYSKGSLDILRFLVDFPEFSSRVDAVVSVGGPIFGTPLADAVDSAYATLVGRLPYEKCPPGDGQVIHSLKPETAAGWLAENPLPANVRYYSLAAFTTRKHMARSLVPTWKYLNRFDVHNDGQVIAADALIPGATLLGFANADHWGVAESIEKIHTFMAGRPSPRPFPLEQLFLSIVRFVLVDSTARATLGGVNSSATDEVDGRLE